VTKRGIRRLRNWSRKRLEGQMYSFFSFIMITFYTFIISTAVSPFECTISEGEKVYTFVKENSQRCFDASWMKHFPFVFFFLLFYLVIFPLKFFMVFFKYRTSMSSDFYSRFGSLVTPYKTRTFYWELVLLIKRIVFILSSDFGNFQGSRQLKYVLMLTTLSVFFVIEAYAQPYTMDSRNKASVA
jgi:hypothetical protein